MNHSIITKFTAFCIALSLNVALLGGVAYLFDGTVHSARATAVAALVAAPTAGSPKAAGSFC